MSLKSIWQTIKSWFNRELDPKIQQYAAQSLEVTTNIKNWLDNPLADLIVGIIPGTWDDNLRARMREALEKTLPTLTLVKDCSGKGLDEMVECFGKGLLQYPASVRYPILMKLAQLLTAIQDDKNEKQNLYDLVTQYVYSRESKKNDL